MDTNYKGAIRFNENPSDDETYFPFVFLVGYSEDDKTVEDIWFSYFKDTRHLQLGGKLKMGHGPGGSPVVSLELFGGLIPILEELNILP